MKQIIIKTQKELDKIKIIKADEEVIIQEKLKLNCRLEVFGKIIIEVGLESDWANYLELRGSSHAELWDSSHAELWDSSHAVLRDYSHAVLRDSSHAELWDSSHAVLWGSSHAVLWDSSHAVLWDYSSVNVSLSFYGKIKLFGFSVAIVPDKLKIKIKKTKNAIIQRVKDLGWFENNGVKKTKKVILYKRVSKDFTTQEGAPNETKWAIGSIVICPNWRPQGSECGDGKFHAVSRPYFADEFRSEPEDKYIAIEIALADLYEWKKNPQYPHKIGFRTGKVIYECDRYGEKIGGSNA